MGRCHVVAAIDAGLEGVLLAHGHLLQLLLLLLLLRADDKLRLLNMRNALADYDVLLEQLRGLVSLHGRAGAALRVQRLQLPQGLAQLHGLLRLLPGREGSDILLERVNQHLRVVGVVC